MNDRVRALVEQARKLSPQERLELVDLLEAEFSDHGTPEEIEAAWLEEVQRRIAASERGETTPVPLEAALERARRRIRQP
jgi:putative addiction module component (TIGR02574 family)